MTWLAYVMIFGLLGAFAASVVLGLWWAMRSGQFSNISRGARVIFDEEEPEGFRTDGFPGEQREMIKRRRQRA